MPLLLHASRFHLLMFPGLTSVYTHNVAPLKGRYIRSLLRICIYLNVDPIRLFMMMRIQIKPVSLQSYTFGSVSANTMRIRIRITI